MGWPNFDDIAAYPESAAGEGRVITCILQVDQGGNDFARIILITDFEIHNHIAIALDRAETIDTRYRRDDDHIIPLEQSPGGGMTHTVNLLVDARIFFDKGIGPWHIGFGLIIIIIRDEIGHRIVGEKFFKLAI